MALGEPIKRQSDDNDGSESQDEDNDPNPEEENGPYIGMYIIYYRDDDLQQIVLYRLYW